MKCYADNEGETEINGKSVKDYCDEDWCPKGKLIYFAHPRLGVDVKDKC